ncbi:MAG: resolvase [Chloroflexi bacterium]|nr:resolvase [Chloroflexota bacterium]|tara:strand:+ start:3190 stop:3909 length:720 start_codon:yes stop_codon:yes gene_type:complete
MSTLQRSFVSYLRVSTPKQGISGLGIEAQRHAIHHYIAAGCGHLVREFVEIESGKGASALRARPELRAALDLARHEGATLLIAKLDRLARNVHFVSGLIESRVAFIACDMPEANKAMLQIHAVMAEHERDQISLRTRVALRAAQARGVELGRTARVNAAMANAERQQRAVRREALLFERVSQLMEGGLSLRQIAAVLTSEGHTPELGGTWHPTQIARVARRGACKVKSDPDVAHRYVIL